MRATRTRLDRLGQRLEQERDAIPAQVCDVYDTMDPADKATMREMCLALRAGDGGNAERLFNAVLPRYPALSALWVRFNVLSDVVGAP